MNKKVLITGFEPFGGETVNPSWEAVCALPDSIDDVKIEKLQIPVVYTKAADAVWEYAEQYDPSVIICVGQAGGRKCVTPEKVAINLRNSTEPDNNGKTYCDETIEENAPAAYFTTLPIIRILDNLKTANVPSEISYTAGAYVCNETMYKLLHYAQKHKEKGNEEMKVGFIHLPYLPEQTKNGEPSMSLSDMVKALEIIVKTVFETEN